VFISRPVPYNPEEHDGFIPKDYVNEAPTESCDVHTYNLSPQNPIDSLPPGSITLPNGTVIMPDGRKILPNGTIIFPDGTIVYPSPNEKLDNDSNSNSEFGRQSDSNSSEENESNTDNQGNINVNNIIDSNDN
jgi:penicillin-binding protein 1A